MKQLTAQQVLDICKEFASPDDWGVPAVYPSIVEREMARRTEAINVDWNDSEDIDCPWCHCGEDDCPTPIWNCDDCELSACGTYRFAPEPEYLDPEPVPTLALTHCIRCLEFMRPTITNSSVCRDCLRRGYGGK